MSKKLENMSREELEALNKKLYSEVQDFKISANRAEEVMKLMSRINTRLKNL